MKKKKLVYGLGVMLCLAGGAGAAVNILTDTGEKIVTEGKKLPVRSAAGIFEADALSDEASLTEGIDDTESTEKTAEYLGYYFNISPEKDDFFTALEKICPSSDGEKEEELSNEVSSEQKEEKEPIEAAVIAVGKQDLALTYSEEKIKERLEFYGVSEAKNKNVEYSYIVCALDLGMINGETAQHAVDGEMTEEEQSNLLMSIATLVGKGRNYLGYSNDSDIFARLRFLYELYQPFSEEEMEPVAGLLFKEELTGECVLKKSAYDARFLPSLTVYYSHASLEHMEQLLGLLNSENIVVKVQLEPKMLIGKADAKQLAQLASKEETEEQAKKKTEEKETLIEETSGSCVGTLGYDLVLEFENQEDMARFEVLVEEYAQITEKDSDTEEAVESFRRVISGAESEHIYVTAANEKLLEGKKSKEIEKIIIENENARLEMYCLSEHTDSVKEKMEEAELKSSLKLYNRACLCNREFFLQLGGVEEQAEEQTREEE